MGYINAISGKTKTRELLEIYNADPGLVQHIMFFDSIFPQYEYWPDEIMAEGDRVMVRARLKATHEGEFLGIPATHKEVEIPFVVGYEIHNNKIVHSWILTDMLPMMERLGVRGMLMKEQDVAAP